MTTTASARVIGPTRRTPRLPEAWLRAALAGVEAAVLGWLVVVVPTVAAYVATAAAPVLGEASWMDAAVVGTGVWLLGHGAAITMSSGAVVSLAPLGVTLGAVALVYGAVRRARLRGAAAGPFVVAGYLLSTLALSAIVPGAAGRPLLALGAALVAGLGLVLALWRVRALPPSWWVRLRTAAPSPVRAGTRAGLAALGGLLLLATVLTGTALVQGIVTVLELHETLEPGRLGTAALVLGQLAYLPTAVVWVLAWLVGPGFRIGEGTLFSASEVVTGPLPSVPLLGALPAPGSPGLGWWVLGGVLVGVLTGVWLHRRHFEEVWWRAALSGVVAAAAAAVVAAFLTIVAGGAIGPARMSVVGAQAPAVAGAVAWQIGVGAVAVLLAANPQVHAAARQRYRSIAGWGGARRRTSRHRTNEGAADQ